MKGATFQVTSLGHWLVIISKKTEGGVVSLVLFRGQEDDKSTFYIIRNKRKKTNSIEFPSPYQDKLPTF